MHLFGICPWELHYADLKAREGWAGGEANVNAVNGEATAVGGYKEVKARHDKEKGAAPVGMLSARGTSVQL